MPLPSQNVRPIANRSHMYRRARMRRFPRRLLILAVLVAGAGAAWYVLPRGGTDALSDADRLITLDDNAVNRDAEETPMARDGAASPLTLPSRQSAPPLAREEPSTPRQERVPSERRDAGNRQPTDSSTAPLSDQTSGATPSPASTPTRAPEPERTRQIAEHDADPGRGPSASRELQREMERISRGREEIARNRPVEGRRTLSMALRSGVLPPHIASEIRTELGRLNERLVFSPEIVADDPYAFPYIVERGDALSRLPRKLGVQTDWRFIQRINGIRSPSSIAIGRRLKMITGPFHAVVHKNDFRLDLWLGDEQDPVFVRSFSVGLGADDGTPEGRFRVRPNSKLINPEWINPRTRERFLPDDPMNPIGEHWIGLVGDEPHLAGVEGYGLHGTIEPDSIGTQSSMGCVRMRAEDIELIYEVLTEPSSIITIRR